MSRLIAFAGPAGSGKSTAAAVLGDHGFELVKFASPLKSMMRAFYRSFGTAEDTIERKIEGDLKEHPCAMLGFQTPRHAMQTLGTEWGRDTLDPDLWVNAWTAEVKRLLARDDVEGVVVDDCRFANEAAAVRELGGTVVLVQGRSGGLSSSHASEKFAFTPDKVVTNCGSLQAFEAAIRASVLVEDWRDVLEALDDEPPGTIQPFRGSFARGAVRAALDEMVGRLASAAEGCVDENGEFRHSWAKAAIARELGIDLSEDSRAEEIDGGPYAEIWDSRNRADPRRERVQQSVTAAYADREPARVAAVMADVARAFRHVGKHTLSDFNPAELICFQFYVDCIGAGLPFDPKGMDDFLDGLGIETPVPF